MGSAFRPKVKVEKVKWGRTKIALNLSCNVKKLKVGKGCKRDSLDLYCFEKKNNMFYLFLVRLC